MDIFAHLLQRDVETLEEYYRIEIILLIKQNNSN